MAGKDDGDLLYVYIRRAKWKDDRNFFILYLEANVFDNKIYRKQSRWLVFHGCPVETAMCLTPFQANRIVNTLQEEMTFKWFLLLLF